MDKEDVETRQKGLENLILLVLGEDDNKLSLLHLEKEVFLLWNFHPKIQPYLNFVKYYRGPFSREIQESVFNPLFLEDCWIYFPPEKGDKLSGGYIKITDKGKKEFNRIVKKLREKDELLHLLVGIKMVRKLYDNLTVEELLLLIYDTYPEYIEKSDVYGEIKKKKVKLSEGLMEKGLIDKERFHSIVTED